MFTRFTKIFIFSETPTGKETAEIFENNWLGIYGIPNTLLSDNGRQYCSSMMNKVCEKYNIKQEFASPFNTTGNSVSERINSSLGNILRIEKVNNLKKHYKRSKNL